MRNRTLHTSNHNGEDCDTPKKTTPKNAKQSPKAQHKTPDQFQAQIAEQMQNLVQQFNKFNYAPPRQSDQPRTILARRCYNCRRVGCFANDCPYPQAFPNIYINRQQPGQAGPERSQSRTPRYSSNNRRFSEAPPPNPQRNFNKPTTFGSYQRSNQPRMPPPFQHKHRDFNRAGSRGRLSNFRRPQQTTKPRFDTKKSEHYPLNRPRDRKHSVAKYTEKDFPQNKTPVERWQLDSNRPAFPCDKAFAEQALAQHSDITPSTTPPRTAQVSHFLENNHTQQKPATYKPTEIFI